MFEVWDIVLSKVELESFLKSFIIFFIAMTILIGTIYSINYRQDIQKIDEQIFNEMRICSFDLQCKKYEVNFVLTKKRELYKLYKKREALSAYFSIPNSTKNSIEISYPIKKYNKDIEVLFEDSFWHFSIAMLVVFIFSIFFSLYTLHPLRNALRLTEEFVKDILHDFNTPLSTLRLNSSMLEKEGIQNKKIKRIQKSVQSILDLQENLRLYLNNAPLQKEEFDLHILVSQRLEVLKMSYEHLDIQSDVPHILLSSNKNALTRIMDNILSNAAKYNKRDGSIYVYMEEESKHLCIQDSGKGIKNPKKIFERFYKEQERGVGIGLHIVKKLSSELGIKLSVDSKEGVGTTFCLQFQ
jgi:two-component system, OmpR family, sensor kinase